MAKQGQDEELDVDSELDVDWTLSSSPPELYDPSMVSLKSVRSNLIVIGWFYLVRIEEIHI